MEDEHGLKPIAWVMAGIIQSWNQEGARLSERTPVKALHLTEKSLPLAYQKAGVRNPRDIPRDE